MIRIAISGAGGRMGRTLVRLVAEADDLELAGAVEAAGHDLLGTDAGEMAGAGRLGVALSDALPETVDCVVDFSLPEGSLERIEACAERAAPIVVGTTGFTNAQRERIDAAAARAPVLVSPNMSVGVNLLFRTAADLAKTLGPDYDIEVLEAHHRFKKDAPSGTALKIAEEIARATGRDLADSARYGRGPGHAPHTKGEIGLHAVRGGDIVGEHTVYFTALGERIELKHVAHSRETFARGALRAARWLVGREPALYTMADVMGL